MAFGIGSRARLAYGYESSFGAGATANIAFGVGQRLTGISGRNNVERIWEIGRREAGRLVGLRFEGTWSVECIMGNRNWLESILEPVSTQSGTQYVIGKNVRSMCIEVGFEGATRVLRTLRGCIVRRVGIEARVNEPVRLRFEGMYAREVVSNPTSVTAVEDSTTPATFANATLNYDGVTVAYVQNVSIDLVTNNELLWALGQRTAQIAYPRMYEIAGRFTAVARNDDLVRDMLGLGSARTDPAEQGTVTEKSLVLNFSNAQIASMQLTGVIDEIGSAIEANELIMFDATFTARNVVVQ